MRSMESQLGNFTPKITSVICFLLLDARQFPPFKELDYSMAATPSFSNGGFLIGSLLGIGTYGEVRRNVNDGARNLNNSRFSFAVSRTIGFVPFWSPQTCRTVPLA